MARMLRYAGQGAVYMAIAAVLGYFASGPVYTHFPADKALIKLSFVHAGARKSECRRRNPEELAELAANMRRPLDCPRQRLAVFVELVLDGRTLFRDTLPPTGWSDDGPSRVYERFAVSPGRHHLAVRMRDSDRTAGFDYEHAEEVVLHPGENLAIDFRADAGRFVFM